jgi:hypothetical protein
MINFTNLNKIVFRIGIICIIFPLRLSSQNDSIERKNILSVNIGYPIPASGISFKNIYYGIFDSQIGYTLMKKHVSFGINAGYSYFKISRNVLDIKGSMQVISPGFSIGYDFKASKKLSIQPLLKFGYDFIVFNGKDVNGNSRPSFNESGISLTPMIAVNYFFTKRFGTGMYGSYKVILQHFGNNAVLEESTIRIMNMGISILYKL